MMQYKLFGWSEAKRTQPMAGQMPTPLFQEWFGLNRNLNSHFADKTVLHIIIFFGGGGR